MKKLLLILMVLVFGCTSDAGEVRLLGKEDLSWGNPSATWTSPGGVVTTYIDNTYSLSAPYVDVRAYGVSTTETAANNSTYLTNAMAAGRIIVIPAGTYNFNTLTIPSGIHLMGAGSGVVENWEPVVAPGTILTTTTTDNAITLGGNGITISNMKIVKSGGVAGKGIVANAKVMITFDDIWVHGFEYQLYLSQSLYHIHRGCRYEGGTYGVYYWGVDGVWNHGAGYFNNVLYFENVRALNNTSYCFFIKGVNVTMINPDASQCDTGIRVFGDVLGSPAYGILIVNTYTETTDKPFSFYRASVVINGGYLQGNSPSAKYYAPISAGDSYVLVNNLDTAGYWTYAYDLQFSSSLQFGHKVYDTLGGTEYVDATSSVGTPSTTGSFTLTATGMTTSPTGTAYWAKYGDLVTINLPSISGTSNANTFTLTGFPVALLPNTGPSTGFIVRGIDNNVSIMVMATITAGDNTITLSNNISSVPNTWVSSGTKGIMTTSISYSKKQ